MPAQCGPSVVDLFVCGTAAARGLVVLHDDADYDADYDVAQRHLPDVGARRIVSGSQ